jgi:translation initiation factor IF-2
MDYSLQAVSTRRPPVARKPRKDESGAPSPSPAAAISVRSEEVVVQLPITIKEFSATSGLKVADIMKSLLRKGLMLSMNAYLDDKLLDDLAKEFQIKIQIRREDKIEDAIVEIEKYTSRPEELQPRAPVVTFLGHVDHGKTSLLDYIRKTRVVAKEHGGITQHLGAYRVDDGAVHVVFIDTPGHKAFTEMRSRGANITDVAVLVVASDEGVMPQTEEAYNHAKAAGVPIVVALSKIDKPNANPQRCMDQIAKIGLLPVSWGGTTEVIQVSAFNGQGVSELLETLSLESEILELKADPTRPALGTVLEAESNPGRGILATVLVQNGTLRIGDYVLCGQAHGRVRNLWLNGSVPIQEAAASSPVQISGLSVIPEAGDRFYVFADAQKARQIAEARSHHRREEDRARSQKFSLDNIWEKFDKTQKNELRLIVKADVKGTLQALENAIGEIGTTEVQVKLLHSGVGAIGQDDVLLAHASQAIILGFNTNVDDRARSFADEKQVEIRTYKIIYEALDDIRQALEEKLAPVLKEVSQGQAEIRKVYHASKVGSIAGCFVKKGSIFRDSKVRVIRNGKVVHTGTLSSLKRFKDDVREAKEGFECGLKVADFEDIQEGDLLEAFTIVKEKRNL